MLTNNNEDTDNKDYSSKYNNIEDNHKEGNKTTTTTMNTDVQIVM